MTARPEAGGPRGGDRVERRVAELLQDAREAATQHDWSTVLARAEPGEWRQLTVLFCDMVGSTTLAAEHDPSGQPLR